MASAGTAGVGGAVKLEEAGVRHLRVVRDGEAGIGVSILWFVCQPEFGFAEEDLGPSCLGGAGQDAGKFLQVGSDGLAECSNFFTVGHVHFVVGDGVRQCG